MKTLIEETHKNLEFLQELNEKHLSAAPAVVRAILLARIMATKIALKEVQQ